MNILNNRNGKSPGNFMWRLGFLFLVFTAITDSALARQDKTAPKTQLIDLFYQAIATEEGLEDGPDFQEISLTNYTNEVISPEALIARYPETRKYLVQDSMMVVEKSAEFQGFIEDLAFDDSKIEIRNFIFKEYTTFNLNLYADLESEVFNASELLFKNCVFENTLMIWFSNINIVYDGNRINHLFNINETLITPKIEIFNNEIDFLQFWTAAPRELTIGSNSIGYMEIDLSSALSLQITNNTFRGLTEIKEHWISFIADRESNRQVALGAITAKESANNVGPSLNKLMHINSTERSISDLKIIGNRFLDPTGSKPVILSQQSAKMEIIENVFEAPLLLYSNTGIEFIMEDNEFYKVNMSAAMPETPRNVVRVDWKDLKGKLYYQRNESTSPYNAVTDAELADTQDFFSMIAGYSRLLEVYKSYGNLDDANNVYLDMKNIHLRRYDYLYRTEGGTTNFFQLYLNKLLSVYTRHGTDPAQAMTASLWIIIFFSGIYFFYPSDWDKTSKSKLMADFRAFAEKNDQGYFIPFLIMIAGILRSFLNAVTLSVNSFVTLGFGTIPTRGLAKYICIFQGFLGWFLLSIFIVSLINQILI